MFSGSFALSDYIRGKILTGFPWNLWGYSWSWLTEVLQILNFLGLFAFNLIVITIFTVPAVLFFKMSLIKRILIISSTFLLIFSIYIYGTFSINKNKGFINYLNKNEKIYIKVISPNFELKYNSSIKEIEQKLENLVRYSDPDPKKETLFVWPEGIFTGFNISEIYQFRNLIKDRFKENHLILFGINTLDNSTGEYFNSLVVINNKFKILHQYNKKKLVPFGEFIPFEKVLNRFGLKKITQGYGAFSEGKTQQNIVIDNLNILPLICYEIIFPELTQKANKNTNLIVNISEDGWFGDSIGPHQHFTHSIFRAIESGKYIIRSANNGMAGIINPLGVVEQKVIYGQSGYLDLNSIRKIQPTIFSKYGNKIFGLLILLYIFLIISFNREKNE